MPQKNSRTVYLGVDPGLSGALAFYDTATDDVEVFDMPCHRITRGSSGTKKRSLDLYELGLIIKPRADTIHLAVVEDVHAMPGQGVSSMFAFGFAAGAVQAAIASHLIPMRLTRPSEWKRVMNLSADKDASRQQASRRFPQHHSKWNLVKHDGRAEALLLAVYGLEYLSMAAGRMIDAAA